MIEEVVSSLSFSKVAWWGTFAVVVGLLVFNYELDRRPKQLGTLAPRLKTYLPLSIDFILFRALKSARTNDDLRFFNRLLAEPPYNGTPHKTIELKLHFYARSIFTVDPENIKAILTGQFADFGKGWRFHEEWKEFLGDSIFTTDGDMWARSRALIRPMFARERYVDTEIFEKHIENLIPQLNAGSGGSGVVDIQPLMFRYTLDAATDYLLGQSVDSLHNPKTVFAEAFQYVLHRQSEIFRAGPLNVLFPKGEFRRNLKKMDDFIQQYITKVLALSPEELDHKLSKQESFLHALARFTRDPTVLRDQLVAILLAGRDTTAGTLSFCLFELSRHPAVVRKVRAEILAQCGTRKPTYADLKEMKYLSAIINETMRLYPVVPFNVRHALVDTTLPRGGGKDGMSPVGVCEDTRIIYSTMAMQRRRDLYDAPPTTETKSTTGVGAMPSVPETGEKEKKQAKYFDPDLFMPDRWVSGWQPKPWHFIPFNGGPRICLGQQFAMIEMGYTITRIFQHYSEIVGVGCPPPGTDPVFRFDVTLSAAQELGCVFVKDNSKQDS